MSKLDSGSGLLGTRRISLAQLKSDKCEFLKEIPQSQNTEILHKLHCDGIYIDDPEVNSKFTDVNIQKLEERLLKNGLV